VGVDDSENQSTLVKRSTTVDDDADSYVSFKDLASAEELGKWEGVYEKDGLVVATITRGVVEWAQGGSKTRWKAKSKSEITIWLPPVNIPITGKLQPDGSIVFNEDMTWTRPKTNGKAARKADAPTSARRSESPAQSESSPSVEMKPEKTKSNVSMRSRNSAASPSIEKLPSKKASEEVVKLNSNPCGSNMISKTPSNVSISKAPSNVVSKTPSNVSVAKTISNVSRPSVHSPNSILNQLQSKEMPEFEMRDGFLVQRMGAGRRGSGWSENEEKADEVDVFKPVSPLMAENAEKEMMSIMASVGKSDPTPEQTKRIAELMELTKGAKSAPVTKPVAAAEPKEKTGFWSRNKKSKTPLSPEEELKQLMDIKGRNPTIEESDRIRELMNQDAQKQKQKKRRDTEIRLAEERRAQEEIDRKKREEEQRKIDEAVRKQREIEENARKAKEEADRKAKAEEERKRKEREEEERKIREAEEAEARRIKEEQEEKLRAKEEREQKRLQRQKDEEERQKKKAAERRRLADKARGIIPASPPAKEEAEEPKPKPKKKRKRRKKNSNDPYEWTVEQISNWVSNSGMMLPTGIVAKKVEKNHIVGSELLFMTHDDMKKRLGLKKKLHRNTFEKEIKKLQEKSTKFKNGAEKLIVEGGASVSASVSPSKSADPADQTASAQDRERDPEPKKTKKPKKSVHALAARLGNIPMGGMMRGPPKKKKKEKAPEPQKDLAAEKATITTKRRKKGKKTKKRGANLDNL